MSKVKRIFVEKKKGFQVEASKLFKDIKESLGIDEIEGLRIINRYDVSGIGEEEYEKSKHTIFSERTVDCVFEETVELNKEHKVFAVEFLPGQYDQRADSAAQCIQIFTGKERPKVAFARVLVVEGNISDEEFSKIKAYCINSVDSREALLEKPSTLDMELIIPNKVEKLHGFNSLNNEELKSFLSARGLAMSFEDLKFCQQYFKATEKREPSITEIKVIDTYWSDHCRHTTFMTEITKVEIESGKYSGSIKEAYLDYLSTRESLYKKDEKAMCLMDMAVIGMKELRKKGLLQDLDLSDEINACSIVVDAEIDGKVEPWLVMFKNETHNHPTEIEPFGGAATCLGGAIRDPLSGRVYVYQAMRVTGSGDPRRKIEETTKGKLAQKKITSAAAAGYSSYGNQIGLATGQVTEIYHEGYVAKRMEIGAVIGAAPKENVVREKPETGDVIILLGGRTGRDGCGGATGSSKSHTEDSILRCGAEVQKGNAPEERKIQRLFRNPEVSKMIKRCNDFGAGGVSVAIGELTDGLDINLDLVPKKYEGLDGTELAISESQERIAVVVAKEDGSKLIRLSEEENLEATMVAEVTDTNRLKMLWRGEAIVDLSRDFLNTNGVRQTAEIIVKAPIEEQCFFTKKKEVKDLKSAWIDNLKSLNCCSQKGLVEKFDASIGAATVLMPFGGKYQDTPNEGMVAKLPVLNGNTTTGTIMTFGFNPMIGSWSPFHGALYAVVESVAKVVACGGDYRTIRLTFQEYFEKLGNDPSKWGKPFSALLGALKAQKEFSIAAIGGKDSMSGSFKDLDVPPTLVSFAVTAVNVNNVISPEFKSENSKLVLLEALKDENQLPRFDILRENYSKITELAKSNKIMAAITVKGGGIAEAVSKMSFGNRIGFKFNEKFEEEKLFAALYGSILVEVKAEEKVEELFKGCSYSVIGITTCEKLIQVNNVYIPLQEAYAAWIGTLEAIFPTTAQEPKEEINKSLFHKRNTTGPVIKIAKPRVLIPVFPGTNCEYDSARAFKRAGAQVETLVLKNLKAEYIEQSVEAMVKNINNSQIIMLPGGFSSGDEPDGSGKFIATVFRNERIKEAVMEMLKNRDGLMLGVCNGFQALIKLGLVPYGEIRNIDETCPTLTYNNIGRHISHVATTKITSVMSPWFANVNVGDIHLVPVSHGEGRFVATGEMLNQLIKNGQMATQYVNALGNPTNDIEVNLNGSINSIEGITSPDGRILGKMAHSERMGENVLKNVPGNKDQKLFEAGVQYFK